MVDELPVEVGELGAVGEFALKQQVGRFFERRCRRQFVDVVAAVDELAEFPVDIADGGVGRDDSLQPPRRDLIGRMIFVRIWSEGGGHGLILALEDGTSGHDQLLALKKEGDRLWEARRDIDSPDRERPSSGDGGGSRTYCDAEAEV